MVIVDPFFQSTTIAISPKENLSTEVLRLHDSEMVINQIYKWMLLNWNQTYCITKSNVLLLALTWLKCVKCYAKK